MSIIVGTDVTASRAIGTVYQNTSGNDMIVSVNGLGHNNWSADLQVLVGPTSTPTAIEGRMTALNTVADTSASTIVVVPKNYYYQIINVPNSLVTVIESQVIGYPIVDSGDLGPSGANTRLLSTVYRNTTGATLLVSGSVTGLPYNNSATWDSSSSATPTDVVFWQGVPASSGSANLSALIPVPNGHYYEMTATGATLVRWKEYTLNGLLFTKSANLAGVTRNASTVYQNTGPDARLVWVTVVGTNSVGTNAFNVGPTNLMGQHPWGVAEGSGGVQGMYNGIANKSWYYEGIRDSGAGSAVNWWEYDLPTPPQPFRQFVLP